jgi:thiol:disulfide interchange protein DsbG
MKSRLLIPALLFALSACSDNDGSLPVAAGEPEAPALKALEAQGLTIHGPLDVPGGLKAFAASIETQAVAVYVMPDPDYVVIGTLIDAQGASVAEEELQAIVSAPLGQESWVLLEAADWVADGGPGAARIVYVFTGAALGRGRQGAVAPCHGRHHPPGFGGKGGGDPRSRRPGGGADL